YFFRRKKRIRKTAMVQIPRSIRTGVKICGPPLCSNSAGEPGTSSASLAHAGAVLRITRDRAAVASQPNNRLPTIPTSSVPPTFLGLFERRTRRSKLGIAIYQDAHEETEEGGAFEECGDDQHAGLDAAGGLGLAGHAFECGGTNAAETPAGADNRQASAQTRA